MFEIGPFVIRLKDIVIRLKSVMLLRKILETHVGWNSYRFVYCLRRRLIVMVTLIVVESEHVWLSGSERKCNVFYSTFFRE